MQYVRQSERASRRQGLVGRRIEGTRILEGVGRADEQLSRPPRALAKGHPDRARPSDAEAARGRAEVEELKGARRGLNDRRRRQLAWLALAVATLLVIVAAWTRLRIRDTQEKVEQLAAETTELAARNEALQKELDSSNLVARFYATYLERPIGGLPSGPDLERVRPMLSARLARLIDEALAYQAEFIAGHPDEPAADGSSPVVHKPPFIDGDHFSSLFEGPLGFEISSATPSRPGEWEVAVRFRHETYGWEDRIVVVEEGGILVIDDVLYGGAGPFNPSGRLSDALQSREGTGD